MELFPLPWDKSPQGFHYLPDFLSEEEEQLLLEEMTNIEFEPFRMSGFEAKRQVSHFGFSYEFDSRVLEKTKAIPAYLSSILIRSAKVMNVKPKELEEVLFTYYPSGAGIGWHRDAPPFEMLFGISLKNSCIMKLRSYEDPKYVLKLELEPRSAYLIKGEARNKWQHHIPPVPADRYSITIRTLRS